MNSPSTDVGRASTSEPSQTPKWMFGRSRIARLTVHLFIAWILIGPWPNTLVDFVAKHGLTIPPPSRLPSPTVNDIPDFKPKDAEPFLVGHARLSISDLARQTPRAGYGARAFKYVSSS